jgi:hypothetical protein
MNATKRNMSLGTVSRATMRPEDLIPAFLDVLPKSSPVRLDIESRLPTGDDESYFDSEESSWDLESLFDALNDMAPPYCYFGAHEGDGSDYGFWVSWDSLNEDCEFGEVLKVEDTSEVPERYTGTVLHVNDHGNATLYTSTNGNLVEEWACV